MILRFFTFLCLALFAFSCDNPEKSAASKTKTETTSPPPPAKTKIKVQGEELYPSIPFETIKSLFERCDYVDYSFEKLPFTVSRNEPSDLQHSLRQISDKPALIDKNCPPFGRMIYYKDGEIALEGVIYFSEGCSYFVFLENNQPKYANFMTPIGNQFFNSLISQVK